MKLPLTSLILAAALSVPAAAGAESAVGSSYRNARSDGNELPPYLQCVPFAREQSGIRIYGDAHTWWDQAEGRYQRGNQPRVGAVMAFVPHRNMQLGHVAMVSRVIDSRTVLLTHANWSPINGRRGQIERDVKAIDVSPGNDWSQVRVWYDPLQALGKTPWPVAGFIYAESAKGQRDIFSNARSTVIARREVQPAPQAVSANPSRAFQQAFSGGFSAPRSTQPKIASAPRRDVVADIIRRN
ncbi:MAG: CHAP domain-containing protein [Sphingomonadaceae bacterium]|nr:CHAP domain-containing protein [Sphingomonadaceae bacterium]